MHPVTKTVIATGAGVAAIEYLFTTQWYQTQSWNGQGSVAGILFDIGVASAVALGVGMLLH